MGRFITPGKHAATTSIVHGYSSGTPTPIAVDSTVGDKQVLSGALTANTLASVSGFPLTTPGEMPMLSVYTIDATSRTLRIQVTVDGTAVFDVTSVATTTLGAGIPVVGVFQETDASTTNKDAITTPIRWNYSLDIKIASSITETDKIAIGTIYHLT